ncbi:MAG: pseudouridine synthase [Patescibacteria group bacterium]|jgi:23S rRNA pseudouridine2604 synthase
MPGVRINKYIAQSGHCSRRKADELISRGEVTLNGRRAELGDTVGEHDSVKVGSKLIKEEAHKVYIAFNKPTGVISTADEYAPQTIYDYVKVPERTFSIGRLDVGSSGLMILTNDGALANVLMHSRGNHEKEYLVRVTNDLTQEFLSAMQRGVVILGTKTKPCHTKKITERDFDIILTEGKNRQIRRMCEKLGNPVLALKRVRIASIRLRDLPIGEWRHLTKEEVTGLLRLI